ncbi:MAG: DNA-directed RNA polymerase subunit alpha C-terminal domain-containing protein [Oscillospiraceae bacterium]
MREDFLFEISIDELNFSVRTLELLKQEGIKTVKGLLGKSEEMNKIFMNYKKGYYEVREELESLGFNMDHAEKE